MEVIISDVDDTLVCTKNRWKTCLVQTGGKINEEFWKLFLSDTYVYLDTPIWPTLYELYKVYHSYNYPLVLLSGRPKSMEKGNAYVKSLLNNINIKVYDEIYKEPIQRYKETAKYKVEEVIKKGYEPIFLFEDEEENVKAFKEKWPECTIYYVEGCIRIRNW